MIFNYILLFFALLFFAVSLVPKDYKPIRTLVWFAISVLLILAIAYPDAGKGWF